MGLPWDPAIIFLGIYLQRTRSGTQQIHTVTVMSVLFTLAYLGGVHQWEVGTQNYSADAERGLKDLC